MKERVDYIDVTKGILILCLLYAHLWVIASIDGLNDNIMDYGSKTVVIFNSFYMQAFFIITGFCSSFNIRFITFLWKNIKTLILPAVILCAIDYLVSGCILGFEKDIIEYIFSYSKWLTNGGPWFIIALFWSKIIYWFLIKLSWGGNFVLVFFCILSEYFLANMEF